MSDRILDAEKLMAAAEAETGHHDYGDTTFKERLAIAVEQVAAAGMDEAGQRKGAEVFHWLLTSRLNFFDDHKRYNLGAEKIEKPLFATGEPRSGTTLLHALLSVDPNGRSLRFWEVMYPSPPPGMARDDDPRRAKADEDWREINAKIPLWLHSHPYNDMLGDGLPEDERAWAMDFRVMTPTAWWRVPMGMNFGRLPVDAAAQYRIHKMMLQHCQYMRAKKYWVLKGFHNARLKELFEAYPDAAIIWTHRDPVQTIASRIAMAAEITDGLVGSVDWKTIAQGQLAYARNSLKTTMESPWVNDKRIHHVRYVDFVGDPVGVIRGFYEKYGVPWTGAAESAMRHYLANNKGDRYGKFVYSTDMIGEEIDKLHEEFAPFRARFGLEIEKRK